MKNIGIILSAAALAATFTGCDLDDDHGHRDREKIVQMTILPETGYGAGLMSNVVRDVWRYVDSDGGNVQNFTDVIAEGFDFEYERGYTYTFTAKKVWMANPPSDVADYKYIFYGPLNREKTITEDSDQEMTVEVRGKVDYAPRFPTEFNDDGSLKIYEALAVREVPSTTGGTRLSMQETISIPPGSMMALRQIEGWEFEPGYVHRLRVRKITTATPYSVRYVLVEALGKQPK